jgi:hypothetical protein
MGPGPYCARQAEFEGKYEVAFTRKQSMQNTQWLQWLNRLSINRPTKARRRTTRRRPMMFDAPAEVLETRQLLSGTPFLAFAVQPGNAIAGHGLMFTVDVMIPVINRPGIHSEIDTAYNGVFTGVPNGPQRRFDGPFNDLFPGLQNVPINWGVFINHGVGKVPANFLALDTAGTYTMTITAPAVPGEGFLGVTGSVTSNPFTISPFTATDRLVFLKVNNSQQVFEGLSFSVTLGVEDQYANVDKSISNVRVTLQGFPGNPSTATFNAGEATFNDVVITGAQDLLVADAFAGPNGFLFGGDVVTAIPLPIGG